MNEKNYGYCQIGTHRWVEMTQWVLEILEWIDPKIPWSDLVRFAVCNKTLQIDVKNIVFYIGIDPHADNKFYLTTDIFRENSNAIDIGRSYIDDERAARLRLEEFIYHEACCLTPPGSTDRFKERTYEPFRRP